MSSLSCYRAYIYIYVYNVIYIYIYIYICTYTYTYTFTHTHSYTYLHLPKSKGLQDVANILYFYHGSNGLIVVRQGFAVRGSRCREEFGQAFREGLFMIGQQR